jgi:hypothetical protein
LLVTMNLRKSLATAFCCALLATTAAAWPTAGARAAGAPKPGTWRRVTATALDNIAEIGLARGGDGVLHVLWTSGSTTGHYSVLDTPIAANGIASRSVTIASHFYSAMYPDGTATPAGLDVFWNGGQSGAPGSPQGTYEATRPSRGGAWHLSASVTTSGGTTSRPRRARTASRG